MTKVLWTYKCFKDHRDIDVVDGWHKKLSPTARANFMRARQQLAHQPMTSWSRPHASPLGNHIYVIRFKDENRTQHRVFGHFEQTDSAFVMSVTGYEKDSVYYPKTYVADVSSARSVCEGNYEKRTCNCLNV
ncbi:type II toxin-antitoxin system RelE/ParE family toxin [Achromobacter xylosoxidans]